IKSFLVVIKMSDIEFEPKEINIFEELKNLEKEAKKDKEIENYINILLFYKGGSINFLFFIVILYQNKQMESELK
ncbi:hypothetical protein LCGC14_2747360, partial [marine sediment metagenome]